MRDELNILSLKDFHDKLGGDRGNVVSYETVRKYHYDRDPSAEYLEHVTQSFPQYRLEWLVAGRGRPTHAEDQIDQMKGREASPLVALKEALPLIDEAGLGGAALLLELVSKIYRMQGGVNPLPPDDELIHLARHVWAQVEAPFAALDAVTQQGFTVGSPAFDRYVDRIGGVAFGDYVLDMLRALNAAMNVYSDWRMHEDLDETIKRAQAGDLRLNRESQEGGDDG
jgi:hypothetical protein